MVYSWNVQTLKKKKEEENPPPKKFVRRDELSTISEPSKSTPSSASSPNTVILMSEGSLHDSGISQEFLLIQEEHLSVCL